jgi:hypothetical protein
LICEIAFFAPRLAAIVSILEGIALVLSLSGYSKISPDYVIELEPMERRKWSENIILGVIGGLLVELLLALFKLIFP